MSNDLKKIFSFCLPKGKPILPHLLRYRALAVVYYSFALGRLEDGVPSTFAQFGFYFPVDPFASTNVELLIVFNSFHKHVNTLAEVRSVIILLDEDAFGPAGMTGDN